MSAVPVELAEALVACINAGTYSMPVNAVRAYRPRYRLGDLAELIVTVVPKKE